MPELHEFDAREHIWTEPKFWVHTTGISDTEAAAYLVAVCDMMDRVADDQLAHVEAQVVYMPQWSSYVFFSNGQVAKALSNLLENVLGSRASVHPVVT